MGERLAALAHEKRDTDTDLAYTIGGESVVHGKGTGLGGRNQEIALAAAIGIDGLHGVCVFSVGSDGTDGPTDAAGGYVDGDTVEKMKKAGVSPVEMLENNDSYHALDSVGALIRTGATGTNVNDVAVLLIRSAARHSK
jgi:hydroxypyruvate reductase